MSRRDRRSTRLRRRSARTVPALLVGILLLAIGIGLAWLSISWLVNGAWPTPLQTPPGWVANVTWNDPIVWAVGVVAVIVGLAQLLWALIPGGFNTLTVRDATGDDAEQRDANATPGAYEQETVMSRRGVAHLARAQCEQVGGVSSASVTATAEQVDLKVETFLRETTDLHAEVVESVRNRLSGVGLDPVPRITATIASKD